MRWINIHGIYYNLENVIKVKFTDYNQINIYFGNEREMLCNLTDDEVNNIKKILDGNRADN